jgi:hypothetical protein
LDALRTLRAVLTGITLRTLDALCARIALRTLDTLCARITLWTLRAILTLTVVDINYIVTVEIFGVILRLFADLTDAIVV